MGLYPVINPWFDLTADLWPYSGYRQLCDAVVIICVSAQLHHLYILMVVWCRLIQ